MNILTEKKFNKAYCKLPESIKAKFKARISLFLVDEFHPLLENHALAGKYEGFRSINITGDFRAIYYLANQDIVIFVNIGTHSQLYG